MNSAGGRRIYLEKERTTGEKKILEEKKRKGLDGSTVKI